MTTPTQAEMERGYLLTAILLAGLCLGAGVVSANEAPLPEAGLDQQVRQGATVYLDAGGSADPDGQIESYRWEITTPNGTTITPDCASCVQTRFRANQSGQYEVTVAVTDDTELSRSDTLLVDVNATAPPSVSLSGPSNPTTDGQYTYQANVTSGDNPLSELRWERDGNAVHTETIRDDATPQSTQLSFDTAGEQQLAVTLSDSLDQSTNDSQTVTVEQSSEAQTTSLSGGTGSGFYEEIERYYTNSGTVYTFNFRNDDQLASNKNGGKDGIGADAGGMGVRKDTLKIMSRQNSDVALTDGSYSETTYEISGDVAERYTNHEDTVNSGSRVGTTDIIKGSELIETGHSDSNSDGQDGTLTSQPSLGVAGSDNGNITPRSLSHSDSVLTGDTYSDTTQSETNGNSDQSIATSRHDSVFNSVDDSSSNSDSSSHSTSSSSESSSNNDDDSGGGHDCGSGEVWYDSLGCW